MPKASSVLEHRDCAATINAKIAITKSLMRCADRLPDVIQVLIDKALAGDRESAIYICDRVWGRPLQESRIQVDATVTLQPSDYHRLSLLQAAIQAVQVIDSPPRDNVIELAPVQEPETEGDT